MDDKKIFDEMVNILKTYTKDVDAFGESHAGDAHFE